MSVEGQVPDGTPEQRSETVIDERSKVSRPVNGITLPRLSWWWIALAGAAAILIGLGSLRLLVALARPLALLILAIAIGASLTPLIERLERRLPRTLAIIAVYLALFLIFGGILWLVIPRLVSQAQQFGGQVPTLIDTAQQWLGRFSFLQPGAMQIGSLIDTLVSQLAGAGSTLVSIPFTITSWIFELVVTIFLSIYALIEAPKAKHFILSLVPEAREERTANVLEKMSDAMGGYVRGVFLDSLAVGILTYIGLLIIGIEFALVLAVLTAFLEIIPLLGPIVAGVIMVMVALLQSPTQALIVLGFAVVLQEVENNILVPNIMRSQTSVTPLMTLFALVAGAAVGGLLGLLIAIPLLAAVQVFVQYVIAPAVREQTGAAEERGERKEATDG